MVSRLGFTLLSTAILGALLGSSPQSSGVYAAPITPLEKRETKIELAARVLLVSQTCPAPTEGNTLDVNAIVVVKLHEIATLSLDLLDNDDPTKRALPENAAQVFERAAAETGMTVHQQEKRILGLGSGLGSIVDGITDLVPGLGDIVDEVLPLRASIEVDLEVCLCANAAVNIGNLDLASIRAAAIADIRAYAQVTAAVGTTLQLFNGLLDNTVRLDVDLRPESVTPCGRCERNQYPTCIGGRCGCANCPAGHIFNGAKCLLAPSAGSISPAVRRSLSGTRKGEQLQVRQAKREDIVKRLSGKPAPLNVFRV